MCWHNVFGIAEICVLLLGVVHTFQHGETLECANAKMAFDMKGIKFSEIPASAISGEHLNACSGAMTCCTHDMETYLINETRSQFHDRVLNRIKTVQLLFANVTDEFDGFFANLLDTSLIEMHKMLIKAYGLLYEQNSELFLDLFHDLQTYFKTGSIDLSDSLDIFFEELFRRIFVLFNTQYVFDEAYEDCVAENTKTIAPFGSIPRRLASQVKKSFVAARMFVRALSFGRDAALDILRKLELLISAQCSRDLATLYNCQYCQLGSLAPPCKSSCAIVVDQCFAGIAVFSEQWDVLVREQVLLAERLEGPLNIERAVEPIETKLSEAIMNFEENSVLISSKVFEMCGQPSVGSRRRRRDAASAMHRGGSAPWPVSRGQPRGRDRRPRGRDKSDEARFADVVRKIRLAVNGTFGFWDRLAHEECSMFTALPTTGAMCWNGTHLVSHLSVGHIDTHNMSRSASPAIHQQLFRVIAMNNKMRRDRLSNSDRNYDDADSGSGDGSGDGRDGSGDNADVMYVNDVWQFASHTTYTPVVTKPVSGVGKHGCSASSSSVLVISSFVLTSVHAVFHW